jgi:hypothetical protein
MYGARAKTYSFEKGPILLVASVLMLAQLFVFGQAAKLSYIATPVTDNTANLPFAAITEKSLNWSGYVAKEGTYTAVSGGWIVPTVKPSESLAADATWVGVGGIENKNLIQAGTQAVADLDGSVAYEAWIEGLPGASQRVPLQVHAGDYVTVSLTEASPGWWHVTMRNNTTDKTFETNMPYDSNHDSAEWIQEMPSGNVAIGLDSFDSVHFISASATKDGQAVTPKVAGAKALSMVSHSGQELVAPSILDSSGAFRVERTDLPSFTDKHGTSPEFQ